jgi:DNA mismatch repair protein MutS2
MEFNEITLEPTYRLLHGLAGASSGLKIAERLQMPSKVLRAAQRFLDAADSEAAHYVEELRRRITDLEAEKSRFETERNEFEQWKRKELDELTAKHKDEIASVEKRLDRIVKEMEARASKELDAVRDDSIKRYQKKLANVKAQATAEVKREKQTVEPVPAGSAQPVAGYDGPRAPGALVQPGASVRVSSLGVVGTIATIKDEEVEVHIGNIKLRRPLDDIEVLQKGPIPLPKDVHLTVSSKQLEKNEINLVGRRVDEALDLTDKFLDDAFLAQMTQVRIVHGSGTGALRQAIAEFLSSHPHVAKFQAAPQAEGGRGVTVVTLRD